jgi:hypothetical protein
MPYGTQVFAQSAALFVPGSLPNDQSRFGAITANAIASFVGFDRGTRRCRHRPPGRSRRPQRSRRNGDDGGRAVRAAQKPAINRT